jgi:hypothetical protein
MSVLAILAVVGLLLLTLFLKRGGTDSVQPTAAVRPGPAAPAGSGALPPPAPATSTAAPSAAASPRGSTTAGSGAGTNCPPGSMALRLSSDAPAYSGGRQPLLTLSAVDIGTKPCTVDLGTTSTALSVLSAGKAVWTSNACTDKVARPTVLTPAAAQQLQLRWDLTRNSDGCTGSTPLPAGQYEIVARVGGAAAYGGNFELR